MCHCKVILYKNAIMVLSLGPVPIFNHYVFDFAYK